MILRMSIASSAPLKFSTADVGGGTILTRDHAAESTPNIVAAWSLLRRLSGEPEMLGNNKK
jgi:hypothetical protein